MAQPTAPLLSFGASGQIAKTLVYSRWKGRPYVRRYVIPANPQSAAQQTTRNTFAWGNQVWKLAPQDFQAPWNAFASGQVLTGRNAFLSSVVSNLRGDADLTDLVFSPGAKGGLAPDALATTPGVGTITADITEPSLPTGWAITSAYAAAIRDQDPATGILFAITSGADVATPFQVVLSGLDAQLYQVGAWFEFTKADGSVAYGPSLETTETPT